MLLKYGLPAIAVMALAFSIHSVRTMTPVKANVAPPSQPPAAQFAKQVGAVGLVEASSENIGVSLPVSGLVTRVFVKAGDSVQKGQPLFTLDDRDIRAELGLRQTALDLSRSKLSRLESAPRPEEIPPAEARVAEAKAQMEDSLTQLRLIESVKDKRAVREEDVQKRRRAVEAAQARVAQNEASLRLLKAGTWKPDLDVARAEVKQAEAQVARIQADINRLTITAPITGRILQVKTRPGEYAQSGALAQSLMLMGNVDVLNVRADIDEKDAWRVRAGEKAVASVRGNSKQKYPLTFVSFEPYVVPKKNLTGDSTERVDTRVLQAIYALPKGAPVYPGQQMDLSIESGTQESGTEKGKL
ncbi:MAG: efflux RND transporter periplasmic adaptor subunit [Bryobacteraceae bacterium]|nr:efflux RND transporter periplasmic adaptor subunit [Bryobacteraceae bacterium]